MNRPIIILLVAAISCNQAEKKPENKVVMPVQTASVQPESAKPQTVILPQEKPPAQAQTQPRVKKEKPFHPAGEAERLNTVMKQYEEKPQVYSVSSEKPADVKGQKGTLVSVDPAMLETEDGKSVSGDIEVELKECINATDFLLANAPTVSNGQLLVSGGAYYINMTSAGNALRIKQGKTISVRIPKPKEDGMELFYGQRDSLGQMNWTPVGQQLTRNEAKAKTKTDISKVSKPDTIGRWTRDIADERGTRLIGVVVQYPDGKIVRTWDGRLVAGDTMRMTKEERRKWHEEMADMEKKEQMTDEFYTTMNLRSLGWINCDRFLNAKTTDVVAQFPAEDSVYGAQIFVVFRDINSMTSAYYFKAKDGLKCTIPNMPVGYKAELISYAFKKDKMYAVSEDIIIEKDKPFTLHLKPVKGDELKEMLASR